MLEKRFEQLIDEISDIRDKTVKSVMSLGLEDFERQFLEKSKNPAFDTFTGK